MRTDGTTRPLVQGRTLLGTFPRRRELVGPLPNERGYKVDNGGEHSSDVLQSR